MSEEVLYSKAHGIATITLNRPEKANTLRTEVIDGLDRALACSRGRRCGYRVARDRLR